MLYSAQKGQNSCIFGGLAFLFFFIYNAKRGGNNMKQFNEKFSLMRDRPFKKMYNDSELFSDFMKNAYNFLKINEEFELLQIIK